MTANAVNGTLVLLQVRTAVGPDVYTTVGGQHGLKVMRNRKALNTSSKDDLDDTFIGGRRNSTVTMDGLIVAGGAARAALITAHEADGVARIRRSAIGTELARQADVIIIKIDEDFPDDATSMWTVELQVTGPWGPIV